MFKPLYEKLKEGKHDIWAMSDELKRAVTEADQALVIVEDVLQFVTTEDRAVREHMIPILESQKATLIGVKSTLGQLVKFLNDYLEDYKPEELE